jgi:hypothetical protein
LRPVTFHLKTDPKGDVQYGQIAQEVAKAYRELVIRDERGHVEGIRYEELAPMLLNELQAQQQRSEVQATKQAAQLKTLELRIAELDYHFPTPQKIGAAKVYPVGTGLSFLSKRRTPAASRGLEASGFSATFSCKVPC